MQTYIIRSKSPKSVVVQKLGIPLSYPFNSLSFRGTICRVSCLKKKDTFQIPIMYPSSKKMKSSTIYLSIYQSISYTIPKSHWLERFYYIPIHIIYLPFKLQWVLLEFPGFTGNHPNGRPSRWKNAAESWKRSPEPRKCCKEKDGKVINYIVDL